MVYYQFFVPNKYMYNNLYNFIHLHHGKRCVDVLRKNSAVLFLSSGISAGFLLSAAPTISWSFSRASGMRIARIVFFRQPLFFQRKRCPSASLVCRRANVAKYAIWLLSTRWRSWYAIVTIRFLEYIKSTIILNIASFQGWQRCKLLHGIVNFAKRIGNVNPTSCWSLQKILQGGPFRIAEVTKKYASASSQVRRTKLRANIRAFSALGGGEHKHA